MSNKLKDLNKDLNAIVSYVSHDIREGDLPFSNWDIAIKDNTNMIGTITSASSKILQNYESLFNAAVVDKLVDNGANIVAKTSMDELGMGGTNRNAYTGPVKNPHDLSRISGGSSGGSAALVAAKAVRMAIGTDTGDSIRKPASYCGIVGLKPTYGRISRYGIVPFAASLDHVGFFTNNVMDAAISLENLAGRDDRDMTSSFKEVEKYTNYENIDLSEMKIAVFKTVLDVMDDEVKEVFNNLIEKYEADGATIVYKEIDIDLARAILPTYTIISNVEATTHSASLDGIRFGERVEGDTLEETMIKSRTNGLSNGVRKRLIFGQFALDGDNKITIYEKAKKVRRKIVDAYLELFDDVDVVMVPAAPTIAPKIEVSPVELNDKYLIGENHMTLQNFCGLPSMTLEMGQLDNMPLGVNISAKAFAEKTLFAYASKVENYTQGGR